MNEREELARDIWRSGVTTPDLLAEYLIREGWTKKRPESTIFINGLVAGVNAANDINAQVHRSAMIYGKLTQ